MTFADAAFSVTDTAAKVTDDVGEKIKEVAEMSEKEGNEVAEVTEIRTEIIEDLYAGELTETKADRLMDSILEEPELDVQLEEEEVDLIAEKLEQTLDDYFDDLKDKSDCPETISSRPFNSSDLEKQLPEITAEKREEFAGKKAELKKQWEQIYERPWPKYEHDIYSANGKLIRLAGGDQDAHHIQPLSMGGKNEVSNITPLSAEVHYDKQGVHSPDSPYSRLEKILGGME